MEHPIVSRRTYFVIYLILLALVAVTVGVAFIDLGDVINTSLALTVASIKAALVLLYFMHVRHSDTLVRLFAIGGLVWLIILIGLTLTDYLTRTGLFFINP
jgi:cytochrome c oxidase subunit IV